MNHTGATSIHGHALFTEREFVFKVADMMMNWRVAMRLYNVRAHCSFVNGDLKVCVCDAVAVYCDLCQVYRLHFWT